jgi:hypothetical protein
MSVLRATPKDRETAALLVPASRAVNDGLELIRTNRRRPATAPTTPSSAAGKASPYPLLGERPLELGERSENTEEEFAMRRSRVHLLGERAERDVSVPQAGDDRQQMRKRSAETIEFPDHQAVAWAHKIERAGEPGTIVPRATGLVLEQVSLVDTGSKQRVTL